MYKIYREDNYIIVVNLSNQELHSGFVKDVFVKRSNSSTQPAFMFTNIKNLDPNLSLKIGLIMKEDGQSYSLEEFEEFYKQNTGNFNGGGDSPGVQSVTGIGVDNTDSENPIVNQVSDVLKANLASPVFSGTPTSPTPAAGNNTTQVATTAFVNNAVNLTGILETIITTGATSTIVAGRRSQMLTYKTITNHTATLPNATLASNSGSILFLINKMSGDLILNTSDGTAKIWDGGSVVPSITIASNTAERLICTDQTYIRF